MFSTPPFEQTLTFDQYRLFILSFSFNRLAWGFANSTRPKGLLAAGLENGELAIWDADKILSGASSDE